MHDAFKVVRDFESALSEYTGAPRVVVVSSGTAALLLAFAWYKRGGGSWVSMPSRTYPSVPMAAHQAGLQIEWNTAPWQGVYPMPPSPIWDCAKRLTSGMHTPGQVECISFNAAKHLPIGQGGAILHDDPVADAWYRRMRFDGRAEGVPSWEDSYPEPGYHCYLSPDAAARGLWLMQYHPRDVEDQEMTPYPDLSKWYDGWK